MSVEGGERMKYITMFLNYTWDSFREYIMGLFPRTQIIYFTNPRCRKMISISKKWMGTEIRESKEYELNEIDPNRIRLEKENLPRITKIIQEYEEENGVITVDKTVRSHT